jgi:hypothetical protein
MTDAVPPTPPSRDICLDSTANPREFVLNEFCSDLVRLHRIIYYLQDKPTPTTPEQVTDIVDHVYTFSTQGKGYHLAGIRNVPTPFLTSKGKFLTQVTTTKNKKTVTETKEMSSEEAKEKLTTFILAEFAKPLEGVDAKEAPYKEFVEFLNRYPVKTEEENEETTTTTTPLPPPTTKDAILLDANDTHGVAERVTEQELGNKVIFNIASQAVTGFTTTPEKRVEAALTILQSLNDAQIVMNHTSSTEDGVTATTAAGGVATVATTTPTEAAATTVVTSPPPPATKSRFLIRNITTDASASWSIMDAVTASFIVLAFCFEVYLEKGIHLNDLPPLHTELPPSSGGAVDEPTDFDGT